MLSGLGVAFLCIPSAAALRIWEETVLGLDAIASAVSRLNLRFSVESIARFEKRRNMCVLRRRDAQQALALQHFISNQPEASCVSLDLVKKILARMHLHSDAARDSKRLKDLVSDINLVR